MLDASDDLLDVSVKHLEEMGKTRVIPEPSLGQDVDGGTKGFEDVGSLLLLLLFGLLEVFLDEGNISPELGEEMSVEAAMTESLFLQEGELLVLGGDRSRGC